MLKISLDEAYVFDMLSVFDVKIKKLTGEKLLLTLEKYADMANEVVDQIVDILVESWEAMEAKMIPFDQGL